MGAKEQSGRTLVFSLPGSRDNPKQKPRRREIRLIEGKKIDLLRDFAAGVYLSVTQNPIPPPLYTPSTCIEYTYSHREGERGGGRVEPGRIGERGNSSQSWVKNTNMTDCISSL